METIDDLPLFSGQPPTEEELPAPLIKEKSVPKHLVKCTVCQDVGMVDSEFCWCRTGDALKEQVRRDRVADDARQLASGTVASMTGQREYVNIEKIRDHFTIFVLENLGLFASWQEAWKSFWPKEHEEWRT